MPISIHPPIHMRLTCLPAQLPHLLLLHSHHPSTQRHRIRHLSCLCRHGCERPRRFQNRVLWPGADGNFNVFIAMSLNPASAIIRFISSLFGGGARLNFLRTSVMMPQSTREGQSPGIVPSSQCGTKYISLVSNQPPGLRLLQKSAAGRMERALEMFTRRLVRGEASWRRTGRWCGHE